MALALLALSSLSQPVRALGRLLTRSTSTTAWRRAADVWDAGSHHRTADRSHPPSQSVALPPLPRGDSHPATANHSSATLHAPGAVYSGSATAANAAQFHATPARSVPPARSAAQRAVRVLHRADAAGPCRLVISGRMTDVCAELDRLAAREALLSR